MIDPEKPSPKISRRRNAALPTLTALHRAQCGRLFGGCFTTLVPASLFGFICLYDISVFRTSAIVSFETIGQVEKIPAPLEVAFTCQSPNGCYVCSGPPCHMAEPSMDSAGGLQRLAARSTTMMQIPFAVLERRAETSSRSNVSQSVSLRGQAAKRKPGRGPLAIVKGTYGDHIDVDFRFDGNFSRPVSTKLLPTLKRELDGTVATTFALDDAECRPQELNMCLTLRSGDARCGVVCASSIYFSVKEQIEAPGRPMLVGQLCGVVGLLLLVLVRVQVALWKFDQCVEPGVTKNGCGSKEHDSESVAGKVACIKASWSSTWHSDTETVTVVDKGPQKVYMPFAGDFDMADDSAISANEGHANFPGHSPRFVRTADVQMVRERIENLLTAVDESNAAQPEVTSARDRVVRLLESAKAVEARLSGSPPAEQMLSGRSGPGSRMDSGRGVSDSGRGVPPPGQLQPAVISQSGPASSNLLAPDVEARMHHRLDALRREGGISMISDSAQSASFDSGFWQRLEALESEAQMMERLERLEREHQELRGGDFASRSAAGHTGESHGDLDLKGRIDAMELEIHGRIDRTETEMREQRLALKVFDASFRHRLEAMDNGLKQHREMLQRMGLIEKQVMQLRSFEQQFLKKLDHVHNQLEQWSASTT